ncbi:MAG TPA: NlpC/P60 family protein [Pyrinomonadaceae bacterium]|nr:NlpC/P60 family protein [Pyrinomonadaceae bacterium]
MKFRSVVGLAVCFVFFAVSYTSPTFAQDRARLVEKTTSSRPVNQPTTTTPAVKTLSSSRPVPTNEPVIEQSLIKKTADVQPAKTAPNPAASMLSRPSNYDTGLSGRMLGAIDSRLGIPYLYGAEGPNRYDCSGFVWAVFKEAGFNFDRSSAASYWKQFEPVSGDDAYKFGTLVFFNGLGHVGIVADKDGFYQASSSKGITYSKFEGYWEKRITGFRRVPDSLKQPAVVSPIATHPVATK